MKAMTFFPRGFGGTRRDAEQVKREGWREQNILVVSTEDQRLTWPERELVRQLAKNSTGSAAQRRRAMADVARLAAQGDEWTVARAEERLCEAADVMKRLPPARVQGYFNTWPAIFHDFSDRVGAEPQRLRRPPPSPDAITRAEKTLLWLRWLEVEDARLVWMRAGRARWREICQRFGVSRATANRHYDYALTVIVWRLERRPLQQTWSRRFLLERSRILREAP